MTETERFFFGMIVLLGKYQKGFSEIKLITK